MTRPPLIEDGFLVEPEPVAPKRYVLLTDSPRRGCSVLGFMVLAVAALLITAAPRSTPIPTSSSPALDVRPGPARPSIPVTATSGPELSGAPQSEELVASPRSEAPVPSPTGELGTALVGGWATWCGPTDTQCQGWGGDALLGAMPSFVDGDRPYDVRVCSEAGDCITVRVVSSCACGDRHGRPTVIDLTPYAFAKLAPLSRGRIAVEVEGPILLPATDLEGTP